MNIRSVLLSIIVGILVISIASISLAVVFFARFLKVECDVRLIKDSTGILKSLSYAIDPLLKKGMHDDIQELMLEIGENKNIDKLRLFSPTGVIVNSHEPDEIGQRDEGADLSAITEMNQLISVGKNSYDRSTYIMMPIAFDSWKNSTSQVNGKQNGVLYLGINESYKDKTANRLMIIASSFMLITVLLILIFISVFLKKNILKPISIMSGRINAMFPGKSKERFEFEATGEIGKLKDNINNAADGVDRMIDDIEYDKKNLEVSSLKRSEFYANASIGLREPLISLTNLIKSFEADEKDKIRKTKFEIAGKISENLLDMVNDVLDISRLSVFDIELKKSNFSLPYLVLDIFEKYRVQAKMNGVEFKVNYIPRNNVVLYGDESRIRQIIENAVGNAFKFTFSGSISITVDYKESVLVCIVRDTGIGMGEDNIAKLFDAYENLDSVEKKIYGGLGLGLPIAKKLISIMGGDIKVKSSIGEGTELNISLRINRAGEEFDEYGDISLKWKMKGLDKYDKIVKEIKAFRANAARLRKSFEAGEDLAFEREALRFKDIVREYDFSEVLPSLELIMRLVREENNLFTDKSAVSRIDEEIQRIEKIADLIPIDDMSNAPKNADFEIKPDDSGRKLKVLITEDSLESRNRIKLMMAQYDAVVVEAENGMRALELLKSGGFDAVFLDVHMPVLDGLETLKKIREDASFDRVRVSIMSSGVRSEDVKRYFDFGCNNIIPKPVNSQILNSEMAEILKSKAGR